MPIEEVATDRVRLDALSPANRRAYGDSWFNDFGKQPLVEDPGGYIAPPLDGIWASAPYFHNGSVPTLAHVLNSEQRPAVWLRTVQGYDRQQVGLEAKSFADLPKDLTSSERRRYFDTRANGKSRAGHTFPDKLSPADKLALLEYLKTL